MFKELSGAFINIKGKDYEVVANDFNKIDYLETVNDDPNRVFYLSDTVSDNVRSYISYDNAIKLKEWLDEMIKVVEDNNKEEEKVKEYNVDEMIREYKDGYKGKFARDNEKDKTLSMNSCGELKWSTGTDFCFSCHNLHAKYTKVPIEKEVPVGVAMTALLEGKTIKVKTRSKTYEYYKGSTLPLSVNEITDGTWYIIE